MSISALIRDMAAAGAPAEAIAVAVEAIEQALSRVDPRIERKRARDAARMAEKRDVARQSRDSGATVAETVPLSRPLSPQTPLSPTHSPPDISTRAKAIDFDGFWVAYPRKVGKDAARKAYASAVKRIDGPDPPGLLIGALERVKATWDDAQFIPHPATWLNQGRWQDEPETALPRKAQGSPSNVERIDPKRLAREANYARSIAGFEQASRARNQRP